MTKILLPIHPEYVDKIIADTKRFEYRTRLPKNMVSHLVVYATNPIKKVVGEIEVLATIMTNPEDLWNKTKDYAGISKDKYDKYFHGRDTACAYVLGKFAKYREPKNLSEFGLSAPPQSYCYIIKKGMK